LSDNNELKFMLIEFLEKLNDGGKYSIEIIETDYSKIKAFIDLLYTVDGFPTNHNNEDIYCFIDSQRKHFNKYHIHDIADIVINYDKDVDNYTNDPVKIITDYINDKSDISQDISWIIYDYASSQSCSNSKNIKELILGSKNKKEKKDSGKVLTEKILKYATDIKHRKDIADIIIEQKKYNNFIQEVQSIIKESKLPRRDDEKYQIISSYEPYELTHCISYEMAIRNQDVRNLLKSIQNLTILSKKIFEYYMIYHDIGIEENLSFDLQNTVEEALLLLNQHNITHDINIKFRNFKLSETYISVMQIITQLIMILEEDYYMIYDRKEIVPEGMEEVLKEPNHYEPDRELNQYMNKVIQASIENTYDTSPRYKDNYATNDGYAVYQASYENSKEYDINKIFPNFKRPMREFNQTQVAFNISLPKNELIAYIEKIKDDYDNKNTPYLTLNQLQERLSQYHGMKIEIGKNNYKFINYDEAQIEMNSPEMETKNNSFSELSKSFKANKHIIHYLETLKVIEERFKVIKNAIDNKKYKKLIYQ